MKYGTVNRVDVYDAGGGAYDELKAQVSVDFTIDRRVLFEFMDALRPINPEAQREPIAAILEHSAQPTWKAINHG